MYAPLNATYKDETHVSYNITPKKSTKFGSHVVLNIIWEIFSVDIIQYVKLKKAKLSHSYNLVQQKDAKIML